jgi:hypothetical protein
MEMSHSLTELGHAGLQVRLWDDDIITEANLGRQRFAPSETGLYKSVALINRVNRLWEQIGKPKLKSLNAMRWADCPKMQGNHYISCVDNVRQGLILLKCSKQ